MGKFTIHGHFQSYYDTTRGYMTGGQFLFIHGPYCPYSKLRNVQSYSIKRVGLPHLWNSFLKQAILQWGNPQFPIVDRHTPLCAFHCIPIFRRNTVTPVYPGVFPNKAVIEISARNLCGHINIHIYIYIYTFIKQIHIYIYTNVQHTN